MLQPRHSLFWQSPPTPAGLWSVKYSSSRKDSSLPCSALKMPLRLYFPMCTARFTVLKTMARTGEYKTANVDGQDRVTSGWSALDAGIKESLLLALRKLRHSNAPCKIVYVSTRFHTSNLVLCDSQAVKAPRHHGCPRGQRSMMSGLPFLGS